ncbi:MAG: sulfotransferase family protein [Actinomycetota bacterium]
MKLAGTAYAIGRALAKVAPASVQRRMLRLRRFSTQMGIWHLPEHGIVYVMVHKVATRSVQNALTMHAAGSDATCAGATWTQVAEAAKRFQRGAFAPEIRRLGESCFTFSFVRNPLDRLLSAYTQQVSAVTARKRIVQQHAIPSDATFADFVRAIAELPDEGCNVHVRSQHRSVTDEDGVIVDYLGRFERLETDWGALVERFGLPPLPHRQKSTHRPYAEAYTPELARLAADRYARDIELFGYEDEVTRLVG